MSEHYTKNATVCLELLINWCIFNKTDVCQGCVPSSRLFNLYTDRIIKTDKEMNISLNKEQDDGKQLNNSINYFSQKGLSMKMKINYIMVTTHWELAESTTWKWIYLKKSSYEKYHWHLYLLEMKNSLIFLSIGGEKHLWGLYLSEMKLKILPCNCGERSIKVFFIPQQRKCSLSRGLWHNGLRHNVVMVVFFLI